jgi:hypothetical protein
MCFCNIPHKAKLWKLIDHLFFFFFSVFVSVFDAHECGRKSEKLLHI